jgi:hypothetical protein
MGPPNVNPPNSYNGGIVFLPHTIFAPSDSNAVKGLLEANQFRSILLNCRSLGLGKKWLR